MLKHFITSAITALTLTTGSAFAAGGAGEIEDAHFSFEGPLGTFDQEQLRRGLKVYTEVCEDQVRAYAAENFEVYDADLDDTRPAKPADHFPANDAVGAPDLSLMAKARAGFHGPYGTGINQLVKGMGGAEYIAALLHGYTGVEKEEAGVTLYENTAFPGGWISMGPPLEDELVEFDDGHKNDVHHMSEDVAAFLMWAAEPKMMDRQEAGFRGVLFLAVLSVLLYFTNKRLWAPIKHGRND